MASFAMLQAYSGFVYDRVHGRIGFRPVLPGDFRSFWALGSLWGEYEKSGGKQLLRILHGEGEFRAFRMENVQCAARNGVALSGNAVGGEWVTEESVPVRAGDLLEFR